MVRHPKFDRLPMVLLLVLLVTCVTTIVCAQPPSPNPGQPVIRFSRVFLPQELITKSNHELIPVRKEQFEKLLEAAREPTRRTVGDSQIATARYSAIFERGQFVGGIGTLELLTDAAEEFKEDSASIVDLGECGLPMLAPRWRRPGDQTPATLPALVGVANSRLVAVNPESRNLEFDWSLAGEQGNAGTWRFRFRLPPSPRNEVQLTLPGSLILKSDRGLVAKSEQPDDTNRWVIRLGSAHEFEVSVAPEPTAGSSALVDTAHSLVHRYSLSLHGADGESAVELDVASNPIRDFIVSVAPSISIKTISVEGHRVSFSASEDEPTLVDPTQADQPSDPPSKQRLFKVRLVPPLPPGQSTIRIAYAIEGSARQPWSLPMPSIVGSRWKAAKAVVTVVSPLRVTRLRLDRCRQSKVHPVGTKGLARHFDLYSEDAAIQLQMDRATSKVLFRSGNSITLGGPTTTGEFNAGFRAEDGDCFKLGAVVDREWTIDDVSTLGGDRIDDWQVTRRIADQELEIRLRTPLNERNTIQLRITGHRRKLRTNVPLKNHELRWIRFRNATCEDALICVRTTAATQLNVEGDWALQPLKIDQLPARDSVLVDGKRGDFVFRDPLGAVPFSRLAAALENNVLNQLAFSYSSGEPEWSATTDVRATILGSKIAEEYRVGITSDGFRPERVVVRLTPVRSLPIRWTDVESGQEVLARKLEMGESSFESWEVTLPDSETDTTRFVGRRSIVFEGRDAMATLTSIQAPTAHEIRSTLTIVATEDSPDVTLNSRLPRLPVPAIDPFALARDTSDEDGICLSCTDRVLARFLYAPPRPGTDDVVIARAAESPQFAAWVTDQSRSSTVSQRGLIDHDIQWRIKNHGLSRILVDIPDSLRTTAIEVNGRPARLSNGSVEIPSNSQEVSVRVGAVQDAKPLTLVSRVQLVVPTVSLPVLATRSSLRLPAAFRTCDPDSSNDGSWTQRLFGFLSRDKASDSSNAVANLRDSVSAVWIYNERFATILAWGLFFILMLLFTGIWERWIGLRTFFVLTGLNIGLLMVIPLELVPIFRALVWAPLAGAGYAACIARLKWRITETEGPVAAWRQVTTGGLLVALMIPQGVDPSSSVAAAKTTNDTFEILIPIDDDGTPNSDYVYVPAKMYRQLAKRQQANMPVGESWIIEAMDYRGRLTQSDDGSRVAVDQLEINMRIHAFRPGLVVDAPLPLLREGWRIGSLKLDGQPISWQPNPNRDTVQVSLGTKGGHRLQVSASRQQTSADTGFDLGIVPIPNSRLTLVTDRNDTALITRGAIGGYQRLESESSKLVDLGPSEKLNIRWKRTDRLRRQTETPIHLHGRIHCVPGYATVETILSTRQPNISLPQQLRIKVDRNLSLLANPDNDVRFRIVDTNPTQQTLLVDTSGNHLQLRFLVNDRSGIGEFSIPEFEISECQVEQSLWAFSVHPSLEFERRGGSNEATISPTAFVESWNMVASQPLPVQDVMFTVSGTMPRDQWQIRTLERASTAIARAAQEVRIHPQELQLQFQASISPVTGSQTGMSLDSPAAFETESVSVNIGNRIVDCQWSTESEKIHVLYGQPIDQPYKLQIHGRVALANVTQDGKATLPLLRLPTTTENMVTVFRDEFVRVKILEHQGLQRVSQAVVPSASFKGKIHLARFSGNGEGIESLKMSIRSGAPKIRGEMLTNLRHENGTWWADVLYQIRMIGGVPDRIVFEIMDEWSEPPTLEPNVPHELVELPNGHRRLILSPGLPHDSTEWSLKVTGPLSGVQNVVSPKMIPISHSPISRYLRLPVASNGQSVGWDTRRVRRVGKPPGNLGQLVKQIEDPSATVQYYELLQRTSTAILRRIETPADHPTLVFCEVESTLEGDSHFGTVSMTVDPAGNREARITVPEGAEILAALIDERLIRLRQSSEASNVVFAPLAPNRLPQIITLVYRSTAGANYAGYSAIRVPELSSAGNCPTLWQLKSTKPLRAESDLIAEPTSQRDANRMRLRRAMVAIETPERFSDYSKEELGAWFTPWRRRIEKMQTQADTLDTVSIDGVSSYAANRMQIDLTLNQVATKLGLDEATFDTAPTEMTAEAEVSTATPFTDYRFVTTLSNGKLDVKRMNSANDGWLMWGARGVLPLLTSFILVALIASPRFADVPIRWRHAIFVVAGLAWIVWLRFPFVGIALIAGGILLSFTSGRFTESGKLNWGTGADFSENQK